MPVGFTVDLQPTYAVDLADILACAIDDDHLDRERRIVLDLERGSDCDHLDVVLQLDLAKQPVGDIVHLGSKRIDVLALTDDGDVGKLLPSRPLQRKTELVVA